MGSEKFATQIGSGVAAGVVCKSAEGIEVCVGNGVMVGILVNVSIGALAGSEFTGLFTVQARVKVIMPAEKNKNFISLIFLVS
jgi:hypothetical protein